MNFALQGKQAREKAPPYTLKCTQQPTTHTDKGAQGCSPTPQPRLWEEAVRATCKQTYNACSEAWTVKH